MRQTIVLTGTHFSLLSEKIKSCVKKKTCASWCRVAARVEPFLPMRTAIWLGAARRDSKSTEFSHFSVLYVVVHLSRDSRFFLLETFLTALLFGVRVLLRRSRFEKKLYVDVFCA